MRRSSILPILFGTYLLLGAVEVCAAESPGGGIGAVLPMWACVPFVGILLSIALGPLLVPHFWHDHYGKVSAFWALAFALPFLIFFHGEALYHILHIYLIDYIPFIILLWALYTISGGIVVGGTIRGTPPANTTMLLVGTLLASWVGTTGAAMVTIRPLLRANRDREHKAHIVCFFIFLVANIGGALTPLGDPPLFLGFLHNVPFFWVTKAILPHMFFTLFIVLFTFFIVDSLYYRKEPHNWGRGENKFSLEIRGTHNFLFLGGVIALVLMSGYWKAGNFFVGGVVVEIQNVLRDTGIIAMGLLSLRFTSEKLRRANEFGWAPIVEVAKLFAGIFMTIIPAIAILKAGSEGAMAPLLALVNKPAHYFWAAGGLSSFLDNAPTYLTFFNMALGKLGMTEAMVPAALDAAAATAHPVFAGYLKAISAGAVFMGANTYIGNAPNFMVKSIAEEAGVAMPSFFGYMLKYSIPVLIPVFILLTYVFF